MCVCVCVCVCVGGPVAPNPFQGPDSHTSWEREIQGQDICSLFTWQSHHSLDSKGLDSFPVALGLVYKAGPVTKHMSKHCGSLRPPSSGVLEPASSSHLTKMDC